MGIKLFQLLDRHHYVIGLEIILFTRPSWAAPDPANRDKNGRMKGTRSEYRNSIVKKTVESVIKSNCHVPSV
jgi:hypothetical protein